MSSAVLVQMNGWGSLSQAVTQPRISCSRACTEVAARERFAQQTVGKWRQRFLDLRLDGLSDDPRTGRPASITVDRVERVVVDTLESTVMRINRAEKRRGNLAQRAPGLTPSCLSSR